MQRTAGTIQRRRNLADAASGVQRATVILYVCLPSGDGDAQAILHRLHDYADARDWVVAASVLDQTAAHLPPDQRPGWARVQEMIDGHQAQGIVTATVSMLGDPADQEAVRSWIVQAHAFITTVSSDGRVGVR